MSGTADASHDFQKRLRRVCSSCSLAELCLPMGLDKVDVQQLDSLVAPEGPLQTGEHLYRAGDAFQALYAVRSGYLKTYVVDDTGREQVLGFHLPGELVGLDAIYPAKHQCNAAALDTATVCKLPYDQLSDLAGHIPSLQKQMFRLLSKDIHTGHVMSGDFTAEERLASFLLGMSARLKQRGYSSSHFLLAMPRRDIANYLRLATETVSRVFKRFQDDQLIAVERRDIRLLDIPRLEQICRAMPR